MVKVSVIVPIYNVELYLSKCLESIINQTYKNIEILLIDDGSTDKSGSIGEKYKLKDSRIQVFHNSNHGVSYSRNFGIKKSTGNYILFIDSDDTINKEYINELVKPILIDDYDLVLCNICDIFIWKNKNVKRRIDKNKLSGIFEKDYFVLRKILRNPVVKLYKKKILIDNKIYFDNNISIAEDQRFNFKYYNFVKKYCYINKGLYNYYHRINDSLSQKIFQNEYFSILEMLRLEKKFLETRKIKNREKIFTGEIISYIYQFIKQDSISIVSYKVYKNRIMSLKKILGNWKQCLGIKHKIILILLKYNVSIVLYFMCLFKYYLYKKIKL